MWLKFLSHLPISKTQKIKFMKCYYEESEQAHTGMSQGSALRQLSVSSTYVQNSFNPHQYLNISRKIKFIMARNYTQCKCTSGRALCEWLPHPQGKFLAREGLNKPLPHCRQTSNKWRLRPCDFVHLIFLQQSLYRNERQTVVGRRVGVEYRFFLDNGNVLSRNNNY